MPLFGSLLRMVREPFFHGQLRLAEGEQLPQPERRGPADGERGGRGGKMEQCPVAIPFADFPERAEIDQERAADTGELLRREFFVEVTQQTFHKKGSAGPESTAPDRWRDGPCPNER